MRFIESQGVRRIAIEHDLERVNTMREVVGDDAMAFLSSVTADLRDQVDDRRVFNESRTFQVNSGAGHLPPRKS